MATSMIERLIQTMKRRLSVLNNDPKWSKITLADKIAQIIQEKKITKPNDKNSLIHSKLRQKTQHTTIKHRNTHTSTKNLSYKGITNLYLDKK